MNRLWVVGLVLAAVLAPAYGASGDDEFLAAREAFRTGNYARLTNHAAKRLREVLSTGKAGLESDDFDGAVSAEEQVLRALQACPQVLAPEGGVLFAEVTLE